MPVRHDASLHVCAAGAESSEVLSRQIQNCLGCRGTLQAAGQLPTSSPLPAGPGTCSGHTMGIRDRSSNSRLTQHLPSPARR